MSETVRKTVKYKLKPTPEQEPPVETVLWRCRVLYTTALEQRITAWQRGHVFVSHYQQEAELKAMRAACPDDAAIHSHVLHDVLARLDKTSQAFFPRLQRGDKAGFPRFKGRDRFHSCTCKEYGTGAHLDTGCLVLAKIGRVAVRWSRPLEGTPKTVTLCKEADGWDVGISYVGISCAAVPVMPRAPTGQATGLALALDSFATLADGSQIATPRIVRVAELNLQLAQRRVSRRKKGSNRRRKAVRLLAKKHLVVKRQRTDLHHTSALVRVPQYDTISHEDVQTANMLTNHHLAKSLTDAACSGFLGLLSFKAAYAGKTVVAVPPAYTSHACSGCGVSVSTGLSLRWHRCPDCGRRLHRDHNAALNILR
jgi:putative transposase